MEKYYKIAGALFSVAMFAAAGFILERELGHYSWHDIAARFSAIPFSGLLLAVCLTVVNYAVITGYDLLAFRYIKNPLGYARIVLTSFIAYAYSNNIGFAALSGSSIRWRFYSAWGLSAVEIAQVVLFGMATLWIGLFCAGAVGLLIGQSADAAALGLFSFSTLSLGVLFAFVVLAYIAAASIRRKPFVVKGFELRLPGARLALGQVALSTVDWLLAAGVLYCLLPEEAPFGYVRFVAVFILAQIAGLISQVPGGLGVFETVILVAAGGKQAGAGVMGALMAYRVIYYLMPLALASVLLAAHEMRSHFQWVQKGIRFWGHFAPGFAPPVMAMLAFIGGIALLFSGAVPAGNDRLAFLADFLPLEAIEASHFLASLVGAALIILARGLQLRLDASYQAALALLIAGSALSLTRGFDYDAAIVMAAIAAVLWSCRRAFYRKASLLAETFTPGWIMAVAAAIGASVWLGFFSYKHVEYSNSLWWAFELSHDAPRFLRASVGAVLLALLFALMKLFRPSRPSSADPDSSEMEKARAIAAMSERPEGHLALLGDKRLLFSDSGKSFIMYAVRGMSWIAMGDAIGDPRERGELIWKFKELCDLHGGRPVFYEVSGDNLADYADVGFSFLKLGEVGRVDLASFTLEGSANSCLRHSFTHVQKQGVSFEMVPAEGVPPLLPTLKAISDAWLTEKKTREKGFSLGFFREDYLASLPCALAIKDGRPVAFASVLPGGNKKELSLDLMRFDREAPSGTMDYLFIQLILWGKAEGYRYFNLGMAPLSGMPAHALAPLWGKMGAFLFRQGEHFYNFQGLRAYKEKFRPVWEPRYLAFEGAMALPAILFDVASLISGGVKGIVSR